MQQTDRQERRRGPSVQAPPNAIDGFARSCNVSPNELIVIDTEKGQYYEFDRSIKGLKTLDLMGNLIQKALADLPIAKRMRWGASRDEFVRPVQWFILSLGSDLIDIELFDLPNSHQSRGHRFHSQSAITITSAANYAQQMRAEGHVIVSFEERKTMIRSQILEQAKVLKSDGRYRRKFT